jgi:hypothetical protein
MRVRVLFAVVFALASCGRNEAEQPAAHSSPSGLALTCETFAGVSAQSLAASYGAGNVVEQRLPGVEGESYTATVLFPNDPARRLEIVWRDAAKTAPASVIATGVGSLWVGPHDLSIGDGLADTERANGRPFQLWGFGWDYGGWVSDWQGGAFAAADGCNVRARFQARGNPSAASGDSAFMSSDAAVRAADPAVSEFGLMFSSPQ